MMMKSQYSKRLKADQWGWSTVTHHDDGKLSSQMSQIKVSRLQGENSRQKAQIWREKQKSAVDLEEDCNLWRHDD